MKLIWSIVALLLLVGLIVMLQPPANNTPGRARERSLADTMEESLADASEAEARRGGSQSAPEPTQRTTAPTTAPTTASLTERPERAVTAIPGLDTPSQESNAAATGAVSPPAGDAGSDPTAASDRARAAERLPASKGSAAGTPATTATADGSATRFEPEVPPIQFAEILPSTFVRLPDGSISADDAWTIKGDGTNESPYEVSWEFLASAQDTYVPRLSENKIPARIAFLSGKRVRISGYLAFPLVAQTSGECLIMLNQWDGCCIGIPPTPYDAVEVKLAESISGWKKHTFNFGSIEGIFTVEPYLVENWLVGLYMLRDATLKRDI
jgi:type II secretory pathway pseudopilin PulG